MSALGNQDLLVAILMRLESCEDVLRLAAVSKAFKCAAESNDVWSKAIVNVFGPYTLQLALESLGDERLRTRYPFVCPQDEGQSDGSDWSLKIAFQRIAVCVATRFQQEPEAAIEALSVGLRTEQVGSMATSFILFCSPKRKGIPDIRISAIKFLTEPKFSPARAVSKQARLAFVSRFDTHGKPLVTALRHFLSRIIMPCEASRVSRIVWNFAGKYSQDNQHPCKGVAVEKDMVLVGVSHDEVYLLMWSLLVLNADTHNPKVLQKMGREQWIRNTLRALADQRRTGAATVAAGLAATESAVEPTAASVGVGEVSLSAMHSAVLRAPLVGLDGAPPRAGGGGGGSSAGAAGGGWWAAAAATVESLGRMVVG